MTESSYIKVNKRLLEELDECHKVNQNDKRLRDDSTVEEQNQLPSSLSSSNRKAVVSDQPLSEVHLGITEYLGKHKGFKGVIKQRYSDFMVTEVDLQSKPTELNNVDLPKEENNLPNIDTVLDRRTLDNLDALAANSDSTPVIIEVETMSKERRRVVHELLRNCYANFSSNTEDRDGVKVIVVSRSNNGQNSQESNQKNAFHVKYVYKGVRQNWPAYRGNYTHFTLYKENIDTMEAINLIAKFIGMKPGSFTYAGVKDKRAKTLQRVSVYRVEAVKLLKLNERLKRMMIGNVGYFKEQLKLGDLSGNRFHIVLRNVDESLTTIENSLQSMSTDGFINYYGMQRFGTTSVPTHAIGLVLLKSDWKLAVELILKPRPGDDDNMTRARKVWMDTGDATKALAELRHKNSNEGNLLRGIETHGSNDLVNAMNYIPRNMRLMYVHSYQSYIWNRLVSKRISQYGLATLEGDLTFNEDLLLENSNDNDGETPKLDAKLRIKPTILKNGQMCSIYDVVIPTFGYDVQYPNNEIRHWYEKMLKEDGLDINNIRHRVKTYSLSGSYRRMIVRPKDFKWSTVRYDDPNQPLFFSDHDVMKGLANEAKPEKALKEGSSLAVKIEFTLPTSSYATMALREVLRSDTSASFQSTLNQT